MKQAILIFSILAVSLLFLPLGHEANDKPELGIHSAIFLTKAEGKNETQFIGKWSGLNREE